MPLLPFAGRLDGEARDEPCSALERQRHRRALDDVGEPGSLLRIEIAFDSHESRDRRFALGLHEIDVDVQCPQWPTLALCVHPQGDRSAPAQSGTQQLEWSGPVSLPPSSVGSSAAKAWRPAVIETA